MPNNMQWERNVSMRIQKKYGTKFFLDDFDRNSSKGIHWLIENGLIQNTPEHIAAFFYNETGLSKRAIGEYLGEK